MPDRLHADLQSAIDHLYQPLGFEGLQPMAEAESADYGAYSFDVNGLAVRFRVAKITPTKIGQFVTLWKRSEGGPIAPFDLSDSLDLAIISAKAGDNFGQFIFPKSVLLAKDILSKADKGGKRAIRVYPPWDKPLSDQARRTQNWQVKYFLDLTKGQPFDAVRAKALLS